MTPSEDVDQNRASSHPPEPTQSRGHRKESVIPASVETLEKASAGNKSKLPSKAFHYMEKCLLQYIRRQQRKNIVVTTSEIQQRAKSFYRAASTQKKFSASHGWLVSFIRRKKLKNIKFNNREQGTTDEVKALQDGNFPLRFSQVCEDTTSDSR